MSVERVIFSLISSNSFPLLLPLFARPFASQIPHEMRALSLWNCLKMPCSSAGTLRLNQEPEPSLGKPHPSWNLCRAGRGGAGGEGWALCGRSRRFEPRTFHLRHCPAMGGSAQGSGPGPACAELPTLRELPGLGSGSCWGWAAGWAPLGSAAAGNTSGHLHLLLLLRRNNEAS